jgi:short-subunit dehydrogenase
MEPRNKGAIINVSSGSGNMPSPYISVYSATK